MRLITRPGTRATGTVDLPMVTAVGSQLGQGKSAVWHCSRAFKCGLANREWAT
jgi:hypothetical protein